MIFLCEKENKKWRKPYTRAKQELSNGTWFA
jgi:hypothetical protein